MTTSDIIERLRTHGYTDEQAQAFAGVLEEWEQTRGVTRDYLRAELQQLRVDLNKDAMELSRDFHKEISAMHKDVRDLTVSQVRWIVGTGIGVVLGVSTIILGAVYFILPHFRP